MHIFKGVPFLLMGRVVILPSSYSPITRFGARPSQIRTEISKLAAPLENKDFGDPLSRRPVAMDFEIPDGHRNNSHDNKPTCLISGAVFSTVCVWSKEGR
jgi:hypothetical protein